MESGKQQMIACKATEFILAILLVHAAKPQRVARLSSNLRGGGANFSTIFVSFIDAVRVDFAAFAMRRKREKEERKARK